MENISDVGGFIEDYSGYNKNTAIPHYRPGEEARTRLPFGGDVIALSLISHNFLWSREGKGLANSLDGKNK